MAGRSDFRELLIADMALVLGIAPARDVAAALQRYWDERDAGDVSLTGELARIADLDEETIARLRREVDRMISRAGGDPEAALARHGGLDRTLHLELSRSARARVRVLDDVGIRSPLRRTDHERYFDFSPIGAGGMGAVYLAIDSELNRRVAFKIVRPDAITAPYAPPSATNPLEVAPPEDGTTPASQAFAELSHRFLQEAWVTGGLDHPGIVPVYELGLTPGGVPYYTMRFVRGERTLETAIDNAAGRDDRLALLGPFLRVCDTIRYAHSQGVIHRDLKPANIALGEFGEVVVLDWGLAKMRDRSDVAGSHWQQRLKEYRDAGEVETLSALGTPGYMSPEAALGRTAEVDERSDVYSLGAILFRILTGQLPYRFRNYVELVAAMHTEVPKSALEIDPTVPPGLAQVCSRALAAEPDDRFADASELAHAVREWERERAREREGEILVGEARAALEGIEDLEEETRLRQVDRASAFLARAKEVVPENETLAELEGRAASIRSIALEERDRASRSRVLRRVGVAAIVVGLLVAGAFALVFRVQKREADRARERAERAEKETSDALARVSAEKTAKEDALAAVKAEKDEKEAALGKTRRLALLGLAQEAILAGNATRGFHLAKLAYEMGETGPEVERILREALNRRLRTGEIPDVHRLRFAPDGTMWTVSDRMGTVTLRDADGSPLPGWERYGRPTLVVTSRRSSRFLVRNRADGWLLADAAGAESMPVSREGTRARFSPDGRHFAIWGGGDGAGVFHESGRLVGTLERHVGPIVTVCFSEDGNLVLSAGEDGVGKLSRLDGTLVREFRGPYCALPSGAAVLGPDHRVALGGRLSSLYLYAKDGKEIGRFADRMGTLRSIRPFGSRFLTISAKNDQAWIRNPDGSAHTHLTPTAGSRFLSISPDGRFAVTREDGEVRRWNDAGEVIDRLAPAAPVDWASFAPRGGSVLLRLSDGRVQRWSAGGKTTVMADPTGPIERARFLSDGVRIATASTDGAVRIWSDESVPEALSPHFRFLRTHDLAVLDGDRLLIRHGNDAITVWNDAGKLIADFTVGFWDPEAALPWNVSAGKGDDFNAWQNGDDDLLDRSDGWVSADGSRVLVPAGLHLCLVDRQADLVTAVDFGTEAVLTSVSIAPNGRRFAATTTGGLLLVWDESGALLRREQLPSNRSGEAIGWSPDGTTIVVTSGHGVRFLEPDGTPRFEEGDLRKPAHGEQRIEFDPLRQRVLVRAWNVATVRDYSGNTLLTNDSVAATALPFVPAVALDLDMWGYLRVSRPEGGPGTSVFARARPKWSWGEDDHHGLRVHIASRQVLSLADECYARLWHLDEQGSLAFVADFAHDAIVTDAAFTPDGNAIWTVADGRALRREVSARTQDGELPPGRPHLAPDGSVTIAASEGIAVCDPTGRVVWRYQLGRAPFPPVASPDGERILVPEEGIRSALVDTEGVQTGITTEEGEVISAEWSPRGDRCFLLTADGSLSIRDRAGEVVGRFTGRPLVAARYVFGGSRLLARDHEERMLLIDASGGLVADAGPRIHAVHGWPVVLESKRRLAVGDGGSVVRFYDEDGRPVAECRRPGSSPFAVEGFDEPGLVLIEGSDGMRELLDLEGRSRGRWLAGELLAVSPSGRYLIRRAEAEPAILLTEIETGKSVSIPRTGEACFLARDAGVFVHSATEPGASLWSIDGRKIRESTERVIGDFGTSTDHGRTLVAVAAGGSVLLWSLEGERLLYRGTEGSAATALFGFSPDDSRLAIKLADGGILILPVEGEADGKTVRVEGSTRGRWLSGSLFAADGERSGRVLDLRGETIAHYACGHPVSEWDRTRAAVDAEGRRIAYRRRQHVYVRESTGRLIGRWESLPGMVLDVDISSDGERVLALIDGVGVRLFEVGSGRLLYEERTTASRSFARFLPGSRRFLLEHEVWSVHEEDGSEIFRVRQDLERPPLVRNDVIYAVWANTITRRRLNGEVLDVLTSPFTATLQQLDVSRDGSVVVAADWQRRIHVWKGGEFLRTLTGAREDIQGVAVSPDGTRIAASAHGQPVVLWSVSGRRIAELEQSDPVWNRNGLRFTPDGGRLLCDSGGSWNVSPKGLFESAERRGIGPMDPRRDPQVADLLNLNAPEKPRDEHSMERTIELMIEENLRRLQERQRAGEETTGPPVADLLTYAAVKASGEAEVRALQSLAGAVPDSARPWTRAGDIHLIARRYSKAADAYAKALAAAGREPESVREGLLARVAETLRKAGRFEEGLSATRRLADSRAGGEGLAAAVWQAGFCLLGLGRSAEADREFARAMDLLEKQGADLGGYRRSLQAFDLLSGKKQVATTADHLTVATLLVQLHRFGNALPHFAEALADEDIRRDLQRGCLYDAACAAARAGQADQAIAWLAQDLDLRRRMWQQVREQERADRVTDTTSNQKSRIQNHFQWAREDDPDLDSLRVDPRFAPLFEAPPWE